jgi:hypothetical protein
MRGPAWMGVAAISVVGFINSALACQFNTDCGVGSHCLKAGGQIYGICAGGMNPGNNFDQSPVHSPLDPNGTVGNTCGFNTDCGPGSRCAKGSGQIQGVCMR